MIEIIQNFINQLHHKIINNIGYAKLIIIIVILTALLLLFRYAYIRLQYSDEAWKIIKKNGRKSIFWYDENGNETHKKPKK